MREAFLLDTHTFLWAMMDKSRLSRRVRALFDDEDVVLLLSVASIWEIALKFGKGKIDAPPERVDEAMEGFLIEELSIQKSHIRHASLLPAREGHKDPFDRLIAAQAISEQVPLVTNDSTLRRHYSGLSVVW